MDIVKHIAFALASISVTSICGTLMKQRNEALIPNEFYSDNAEMHSGWYTYQPYRTEPTGCIKEEDIQSLLFVHDPLTIS